MCCLFFPFMFLATVFLMMLTGLPPGPALMITTLAVIILAAIALINDPTLVEPIDQPTKTDASRNRNNPRHMNFRDIQAAQRVARGQYNYFDMRRLANAGRRFKRPTRTTRRK